MARFSRDIVTLLEAAGVGTYGTSLLRSTSVVVPPVIPSGGMIVVVDSGGPPPLRTHNSVIRPAYIRPTAQLVAHADDFDSADALSHAAYDALVGVRNVVVSGSVHYREINPLQEPFDIGPGENGQARVVFNVMAIRRP